MLASVWQVVVGLIATLGMWAFFTVVLPIAVMVVVLYVMRWVPLTGRRNLDELKK